MIHDCVYHSVTYRFIRCEANSLQISAAAIFNVRLKTYLVFVTSQIIRNISIVTNNKTE